MIRVIIVLVFLFLVWVLYVSGFEKPRKIRISIIALILCGIGFWFDGYDKRQVSNFVSIDDVVSCGVNAEHSYRTNFDLAICVQNNAEKGTISRLNMAVIASQCDAQTCTQLQRVERSMLVNIPPKSLSTVDQNLSFDDVSPLLTNVQWSFEILETKALR